MPAGQGRSRRAFHETGDARRRFQQPGQGNIVAIEGEEEIASGHSTFPVILLPYTLSRQTVKHPDILGKVRK
jgi:hypothetical protein